MYSSPSFISSCLFECIVDKLYDLILIDDYSIDDIDGYMIENMIPDYYEEEWYLINDDDRYDLIQYVRDQVSELFNEDDTC